MNRVWFRGMILIIGLAALAGRPALAQLRPLQPNVQTELHRAETAWRSGGSLLEAKIRADEVLRQAPDHPAALKLRAEVLLALKRYDDAIPDARRATELDPTDGQSYWILAESARLSGDPELARETLRRAANQVTSENADVHLLLSRVAVDVEELELAVSFARVARAKDNGYAEAYYQLARVFLVQGRPEAAVTVLAEGFQARVLDPRAIRQDPMLQALAGERELATWLERR